MKDLKIVNNPEIKELIISTSITSKFKVIFEYI